MVAVILVVFVVWWWWPTIARDPDRLDVLVLGVGEVTQSSEPIERRIREEGMRVETVAAEPCDDRSTIAELVADRSPAVVVVSPAVPCDAWADLIDAARGGDDPRVIVLAQSGVVTDGDRALLEDSGAIVADPARLLGSTDTERVPCLWWDDCEPDGQVTVRRADGTLTDAGAQRVARVLTGNIP